MKYRRQGKSNLDNGRTWRNWLLANSALVEASGLPQSVLQSEETFWYFVDNTYNYPAWEESPTAAWFSVDHVDLAQKRCLWSLLEKAVEDLPLDCDARTYLGDLERTYGPNTW